MGIIIKLSQAEVRVCTQLAVERWLTKFGSEDRPNYAEGKRTGRLEPELPANIRANVSEWAVAKQYNLPWNVPWYPNELHNYRKSIADVGDFEVRTVRTQSSIPFWEKDLGRIIYGTKVLDEEYYSEVEIYGWFEANRFMTNDYFDPAISGWRVPVEMMSL